VRRPPEHSRDSPTTDSSRAVSDAIGFTLMFAIIILGAGLISFTGGTQLETFSNVEEVQSAEHGMESAAATLQPMATRGDSRRSFSIAFSNSNVWINETVLNVTTDGGVAYPDLAVNALQQRFDRSGDDVTVRYEAGGVFRTNAIPAFDPSFECRDGTTALITVVNLTLADREGLYVSNGYNPDIGLDQFAAGGDSPVTSTDEALTFEARTVSTERSLVDSSTTVFVNTSQTAGPAQWDMFFDSKETWSNPSDHVYTCAADRALVRVVTIELDIVEPRFSS
jgi:hypothetical protein